MNTIRASNVIRAALAVRIATGAAAVLLSAGVCAQAAHLPARLLSCSLGHAANFDPAQQQTLDDLVYDSHHRLSLFLPGINERTAPPPDAIEPAEAVDPATRLTEDPDQITADAPGRFNRVVDFWPERVELTKTTTVGAYKAFLISDYDPARGTARIFVGNASDLTSYDIKRIYLGECNVTINPARKARAR